MSVFSVKIDRNNIVIMNNSPKKVLLRLVMVDYEVTTLTYDQERVPKVIHDEVTINKELKENEKIEVKATIENIKKVSIIFKDLESEVTLREDHEI
ncbi:hypothetical protein [Stygiolobus caldivivus]|uniref:Uncharacterized protein n=1 Tax=Stygiolobus caldivivus TaxID=2824673 RepID=A0A8D5U933_9CREN|nr:hypothetical protein [Stygiolobus caldivivus]BCU71197.1 hypothetical protein KN1_24940 [Stygiolobus caldivivus]